MSLPAVLLVDVATAQFKVVTLSLLDRLLVAAYRAGCAPITVVCEGTPPPTKRADALGVPYEVVRTPPALAGPALVALTGLLVGPADVERVVSQRGGLVAADGKKLPLGVTSDLANPLEAALREAPAVVAQGFTASVRDEAGARGAAAALWASLGSSADGPMDRLINRRVGRPLSKLLVHTPVSPNQVTLASMAIGLAGAYLLSVGRYTSALWGALLFLLCTVIDCVDGDIARALFKESRLGKWLDIGADQVVHLALFIALAVGLGRAGTSAPVMALGTSAALGALLSFAVVVRGLLQPEDRRDPRLARLVDAMTSRDFAYLILLLAVVGRLELFLWLAAFGSHAFWALALLLQLRGSRAQPPTGAGVQ